MMEDSRFQYVQYLHSSFFKQNPEFIYIKQISFCAAPAFQQPICKHLLSPCRVPWGDQRGRDKHRSPSLSETHNLLQENVTHIINPSVIS